MKERLPILTKRLRLRPFVDDDLDAFVAYRREPEVARYQSWLPTFDAEQGRAFIRAVSDRPFLTRGVWVNLAMELLATGQQVGDVGLRVDDAGESAELGFTLAGAHRGRGYASEGVGAVCEVALRDVPAILAITDTRNVASMKLLERLGFRRDGFHALQTPFKGELCDEVRYRRDR
jgi:RimJ/RimL family protein N-acetyltransferase